MAATLRFSELVKKSGAPHTATLWSDPSHDPEFKKAIAQNRVLTVKQETVGNKKDFGTIGFHEEKNVSYMIFPKSLPKSDSRVIGIKYDLLKEPPTRDPISTSEAQKPKKKPTPARPVEREFSAVLQRTARWETTVQFSAKNHTEAKEKAAEIIAREKFSDSDAIIKNDVRDVKEI